MVEVRKKDTLKHVECHTVYRIRLLGQKHVAHRLSNGSSFIQKDKEKDSVEHLKQCMQQQEKELQMLNNLLFSHEDSIHVRSI